MGANTQSRPLCLHVRACPPRRHPRHPYPSPPSSGRSSVFLAKCPRGVRVLCPLSLPGRPDTHTPHAEGMLAVCVCVEGGWCTSLASRLSQEKVALKKIKKEKEKKEGFPITAVREVRAVTTIVATLHGRGTAP